MIMEQHAGDNKLPIWDPLFESDKIRSPSPNKPIALNKVGFRGRSTTNNKQFSKKQTKDREPNITNRGKFKSRFMAFKFGQSKRGRGGTRQENVPRRKPSPPDPPPQEPYVGYTDKDFDDIYLHAAMKKTTQTHHGVTNPMPVQQATFQNYPEIPPIINSYGPTQHRESDAINSVPIDYPRYPPPEISEIIASLLKQDQFLDAAKEFERWCLDDKCNTYNFNSLLNLLSTANSFLEKLIESGHSLRDFVEMNRKEEDYRTLLLKEKCHALESIFISCRVTKSRWSFSNYEMEGIEDFCQKAFKGIGFLKDLLHPQNNQTTTDNSKTTGFTEEPYKGRISDLERDNNGDCLPADLFESSLSSVLSVALNTYPNGATINDLANYCERNSIVVSKAGIERVLIKYSNIFIRSGIEIDRWTFNGFTFLNEYSKRILFEGGQ